MKKAISILALLAFLITTAHTVSATTIHISTAETATSDLIYRAEFDALAKAQKNAVEAYDVLYKSFINITDNTVIYPENYGGAHIEDNILYIHVVDADNQDLSSYQTLLGTYLEDIAFINANYPLQALIDSGIRASSELREQGIKAIGCSISEKDNRVTVKIQEEETEDATRAAVNYARKEYEMRTRTFYETPVEFAHGTVPSACYDIMGGTQLTKLTIGACGTYQGQPAFALCGHGLEQGDVVYLASDEADYLARAGTIQVQRFESGSYGDYAIATNSANITPSTYAGDPDGTKYTIRASLDSPPTGTYVAKYGSRGLFAYGTTDEWFINLETNLPSDDPDWPFGVVRIRGLVSVQIQNGVVMHGDSGGPVIAPSNNAFCGVVSAADMNNDNGTPDNGADDYSTTTFYFSPYQFLRQAGFTVSTAS